MTTSLLIEFLTTGLFVTLFVLVASIGFVFMFRNPSRSSGTQIVDQEIPKREALVQLIYRRFNTRY